MSEQILEQFQGDILVLTLNNPPFNFLSARMRASLLEKLEAAFADDGVKGIVLTGEGQLFSRGVPVSEYEHDLVRPWTSDICARVEDAPKPVVMALHGLVVSGAFELALAAHGRVAQASTRVGLPDVTIGLPPGAGGSQRLPRLVGPSIALKIALSGKLGKAEELGSTRLFQQVVKDGPTNEAPVKEAIALVRKFAEAKRWKRTGDVETGLRDGRKFQEFLSQTRRAVPQTSGVLLDVIDCIEASQLLPQDQGLAFEAIRFADRLQDPGGRAERHLAAAQQVVAVEATLARSRSRPISHVALVGGARQISEVAALALSLENRTSLLSGDDARDAVLKADVQAQLEAQVRAGALTQQQSEAQLARLEVLAGPEELAEVDLVFDTGGLDLPDGVAQKRGGIWVILDDPGRDLAAVIAKRQAVLGKQACIATLCIRRPMIRARLAEISVVSGPEAEVIGTLSQMLTRENRSTLVISDLPGGILGSMRVVIARAALAMLAAGVPFAEIEKAARTLGFPRGPFRMMDETGAAQTLGLAKHVYDARGQSIWPFRLLSDRLADRTDITESGRAGLKRALAFHVAAGQALQPDDGFPRWLDDWRKDTREEAPERVPDWPSDVSPQRALQAAMVNEAARMVDGGHVRRAADIDMAMVLAAGFEAQRGGPLLQADMEGVLPLLRAAKRLSEVDAVLWTPVPSLEDMVKYGQRFF